MTIDLFENAPCFENVIGAWSNDQTCTRLTATTFELILGENGGFGGKKHAEARRPGVIAGDFVYQANVAFGPSGDGHLQFRISDEGRYGVSVSEQGFRFYRQRFQSDRLTWELIPDGSRFVDLAADIPHHLEVRAEGDRFQITVDGIQAAVADASFVVGRFGLYAFRKPGSEAEVSFSNVIASADPTAASNFALLYSTAGYLAGGTKRALLRTLNAIPHDIDLIRSRFEILTPNRKPVWTGRLTSKRTTYGMQSWEIDFTSLDIPGLFILRIEIVAGSASLAFESSPFLLEERGFSRRLLKPLTLLNAEARDAGTEDLRQNWLTNDGSTFRVEADGSFFVPFADDQAGETIERVGDGYGGLVRQRGPDVANGFTMTGRVTIFFGCDSQLRFGISPLRRFGITLQAGSGGGCVHGDGPGAVRLHLEEKVNDTWTFTALVGSDFPESEPFEAGRPYDLRVTVTPEGLITVHVDGVQRIRHHVPIILPETSFGLRVWGGSARFDRVTVWRRCISLERVEIEPGEWVERPAVAGGPPCDGSSFLVLDSSDEVCCRPVVAHRHGFHDCNNYIGESNSHAAFLRGLLEAWTVRSSEFSAFELTRLRRAILTCVHYLDELFTLAEGTGRYKHEDYGRGRGPDLDQKTGKYLTYLTLSGVYGHAAFAAKSPEIDPALSKRSCRRAWKGVQWLAANDGLAPEHKATLFHWFAACVKRDPSYGLIFSGVPAGVDVGDWLEAEAIAAAELFLFGAPGGAAGFIAPGTLRNKERDTGQMIPWFEGVYELFVDLPDRTGAWAEPLADFAARLADYLLSNNAFQVIPQSSGESNPHAKNWDRMDLVPAVDRAAGNTGRHFYNSTFFSTMVADMVFLGRMTNNPTLEKLAAGHFYWVLGLNPGVPSSKALNGAAEGTCWKASAFVQNLDAPFSRGFENFSKPGTNTKSWLWGGEDWGPHREVWWFNPLKNGFRSIVNGHSLWEGNWDYHNQGEFGWASGETFMLNDGLFTRAIIAYEDWVAGRRVTWTNLGGSFDQVFAIPNQDGRIEIFATGTDHSLWHGWQTSPTGDFDVWHRMDGSMADLFAIHNLDGRIELFGKDADGILHHRWQERPNGPFDTWRSLELAVLSATVIRNADNRMEIFAVATDFTVHHRWQIAPNQHFDPWHVFGGSLKAISANMNLDGRIEVFGRDVDDALYHRWQTAPNSYFAPRWEPLEENASSMTTARNRDGRMELFVSRVNGVVRHRWQTAPNSYFDDWYTLGDSVAEIQSLEHLDGRIELFALGSEQQMLRNIQSVPNGPFVGWESLGGQVGAFCVSRRVDDRAILFARQSNGEVWCLRQGSPGSWADA